MRACTAIADAAFRSLGQRRDLRLGVHNGDDAIFRRWHHADRGRADLCMIRMFMTGVCESSRRRDKAGDHDDHGSHQALRMLRPVHASTPIAPNIGHLDSSDKLRWLSTVPDNSGLSVVAPYQEARNYRNIY